MYFNICDQLFNNSLFNELENDLFNLSYDNYYHGYDIPPWYFYTYKPKKQLTSTNRSTLPSRRNTCLKQVSSSTSLKRNSTVKAVPSSCSTMKKSTVKPTSSSLPSSSKNEVSLKTNTTSPKNTSSSTITTPLSKETFSPKLNFYEDDANYYIHLDLPGMTKDQIKMEIDINDRFIAITGERKNNNSIMEHHNDTTNDETSDCKKFSLEECPYGKFEKIVSIPESGNLDTIQAKLENGILNITIEKIVPKKQTRTIQIQ